VENLIDGVLEEDLGPRLAQMVRSIEGALDTD
jgi:hypothetical protein